MAASRGAAIRAAADVFAGAMRLLAPKRTGKIVRAIRVRLGPGSRTSTGPYTVAVVAAGAATGKWGWTPINAWMFETPGAKHPVFPGGRPREQWEWAVQPYRPYMEEAIERVGDRAAEVWADGVIPVIAKENGFK